MKTLPRNPLLLRAAAAASRVAPWLREPDRGRGGHDAYFAGLQAALKRAGIAQPTLVVDVARLAANIAAVRRALAPTKLALRVVSKSLPAPKLLDAVMAGGGTDRLMVFNSVMLDEIAGFQPGADVLTGRPLPAVQVADFVRRHANDPAPATRPQWLADSARRLAQYAQIARANDAPLKINLEYDVGLHRGGLPDLAALAAHQPAAFIAQPVLKVMDPALFPRREGLTATIQALDPNQRRGFFLYGGYGDARPVSPPGLRFSAVYGGRAMLAGSNRVDLAEDDFVFMRPTESEGVFLQFGDIAVYDGEEISAWWPTFRIHA